MKKGKSTRKIIITISIISILISLTLLSYHFLTAEEVQEITILDMQLAVSNSLGFNVDTDKIYFGDMPPGVAGKKKIVIPNNNYDRSRIDIKASGEIAEWVSVSENSFILEKDDFRLIEVRVDVPLDARYKEYESKLIVQYTNPDNYFKRILSKLKEYA